MNPEYAEKLKALKEYWFNDDYSLKWTKEVEATLRKLMVKEELAKNKAIIALVEDIKNKVHAIDTMLKFNEDLTDIERKGLFREKKVHLFYLDRFDGSKIDQQFERVGKLLDEELESTGLKVKSK